MRKTKADYTIERLEKEGWMYGHTALVTQYVSAGSVTPMNTRKGREYCRVHHGKCVGRYGNNTYQITTVMYRAIVK